MRKALKQILSIIVVFLLLSSTAFAETIYEHRSDCTLAGGVVHTRIQRLTTEGWQSINIITADLTNPYLSLKLLKSERGTSYLETVPDLLDKNKDVIAGVNADFFQWKKGESGRGSSLGIEVADGEMLAAPAFEEEMAAVAQLTDGSVIFDYFKKEITVTAPNGETRQVKNVNKYDPLDNLILLNKYWDGGMSLGADGSAVELFVEDGIVKDIRQNMPPEKIPENGYVLIVLSDFDRFLLDNFKIGDRVDLRIKITPIPPEEIENAVGGGAMLVQNGAKPEEFSHIVSGRHPRTAFGVDKTGTKAYFVTVDGRSESATGMTMETLADLMLEIGAYNAINFDGGGSTTMAARKKGKTVVLNTPSDGSLRKVSNGWGIASSAPKGELSEITIIPEYSTTFVGSPVALDIIPLDEYGNFYEDFKYEDIKWNAKVENNVFYPTEAGKFILKAKYAQIVSECEINVLPKPKEGPSSGVVINFAGIVNKRTLLDNYIASVLDRNLNRGDFAIYTYPGMFSLTEQGGNTFIRLDPSSFTTENWAWIASKIDGVRTSTLFIIMPRKPKDFESEMLKAMLYEKLPDKNIIVVSGGAENECTDEGGIMFFTLAPMPQFSLLNLSSQLDSYKYLSITVSDTISYEFKNIEF